MITDRISPRPDEEDRHLRVTFGSRMVLDYVACKTATRNFLTAWQQCHSPSLTAALVEGETTLPQLPRIPNEELWLAP